MPRRCSEKLKELIKNSALLQSAMPLFICDSAFTVTAKSSGAEHFFHRPAINNCILDYVNKNDIKELYDTNKPVVITTFGRENSTTAAIAIKGSINNEDYFVLLIPPMLIFEGTQKSWYADEAFNNISTALKALINSPRADIKHLERCCERLKRLYMYHTTTSTIIEGTHFHHLADEKSILLEIISMMDTWKKGLAEIGGTVELKYSERPPFSVYTNTNPLLLYISTLLAALVPLSKTGHIVIECSFIKDIGKEAVDITLSTPIAAKITDSICDFDSAIAAMPHLSLELAAIKDMAAARNMKTDVNISENTLNITCHTNANLLTVFTFHSPSSEDEASYIKNIFTFLCSFIKNEYM